MWKLVISKKADKTFAKLDRQTQIQIDKYFMKIIDSGDPVSSGKALTGAFRGIWRYRVGKYRLLCKIKNEVLVVYLIEIGKRDTVYD